MKKVNIRAFRKNLAKYLEELPIILTRRKRPVAKVVKINKKVAKIARTTTLSKLDE